MGRKTRLPSGASSASISAIATPMETVSPEPTSIFVIVPAAGEGSSIATLSVTDFNQRVELFHGLAGFDQPFADYCLDDRLANVGQFDLVVHFRLRPAAGWRALCCWAKA